MAHALLSINKIVTEIPQPFKAALIQKASERGIMYKLRCVNPQGLRTRWDRVERTFAANEEKLLPAQVAAALIQLYNINMVAGSSMHPGGNKGSDTPAPYAEPNFVEVIDPTRSDLGPDLQIIKAGLTAGGEILKDSEASYQSASGGRAVSGELDSSEILAVGGRVAKPNEGVEI
jgi:hypothetical protein